MRRTGSWSARMVALLAAACTAGLVATSRPSAADDILRSIFSLFGAAVSGQRFPAPSDRDASLAYAAAAPQDALDISAPPSITSASSGSMAYCVRLCDGRFFPLSGLAAAPTAAAAGMCAAMCPASKTAIYRGDRIDSATARNGDRYDVLGSAFVYRQKIVPGCTCNGENPFGLARIAVSGDPTLRTGDIVAAADGLKVFKGSGGENRRAAAFTPIGTSASLSAELRRKLATVRVSSGGRY
jgi:hypothetical protein